MRGSKNKVVFLRKPVPRVGKWESATLVSRESVFVCARPALGFGAGGAVGLVGAAGGGSVEPKDAVRLPARRHRRSSGHHPFGVNRW